MITRFLFLQFMFLILCHDSKSQSHFKPISIDPNSTLNEKIPFSIHQIKLKTLNQFALGNVATVKDEKIYPLELQSDFESSILAFLNNRFSPAQEKPIIDIEVKTMRIAGAKPTSFSPTDTFLFECNFISEGDILYQFKARNSFGLFNEPDKIMSNYINRAMVAGIKQFTKSYNKNPDWSKGNSNPLFNVKAKVIHNKIKGNDTLECEVGSVLKPDDFNGKLPNDSVTNDVISKLILTYKAESEETSKGIELTIYTKAIFDKNRSWKKSIISNSNWLKYQQGHFDLCTYYGLKLRDTMANYQYSVGEFKSELNAIYNSVYTNYISERKQFAQETDNGANQIKLDEWLNKIGNQLKGSKK